MGSACKIHPRDTHESCKIIPLLILSLTVRFSNFNQEPPHPCSATNLSLAPILPTKIEAPTQDCFARCGRKRQGRRKVFFSKGKKEDSDGNPVLDYLSI